VDKNHVYICPTAEQRQKELLDFVLIALSSLALPWQIRFKPRCGCMQEDTAISAPRFARIRYSGRNARSLARSVAKNICRVFFVSS
jgi:hypothetical protein